MTLTISAPCQNCFVAAVLACTDHYLKTLIMTNKKINKYTYKKWTKKVGAMAAQAQFWIYNFTSHINILFIFNFIG
jgi:hypothetical protein